MYADVQPEGNRVRIALKGRFDFSAHRTFRESYAQLLGSNDVCEVEVDFGAVEYLDSCALGMLLMLREKAQAANKRILLSNCKGSVRQVLEIANFSKLFAIS